MRERASLLGTGCALAALFITLFASAAAAQTFSELVAQGRFDEAVEAMRGAPQEEIENAARAIFDNAYEGGYLTRDYEYAIRGMTAAKGLPGLSSALIDQLDFWHGFSVMQAAIQEQAPNTLATALATLPRFQEARDLVAGTGLYASRVNVDLDRQVLEPLDTYIDIQEAIIRRGR